MSYSASPVVAIGFWRLVLAIFLALTLVSLCDALAVMGWTWWVASQLQDQAEKAAFQAKHDAQERAVVVAQQRLHDQVEAQDRKDREQAAYAAAHALRPGEFCSGGTVVFAGRQADGTPAYVQVLESGRPVACSGDHRL